MLDINLFREDKGGNPVRELAIRVVARAASLVLRNGGSSGTRPSIDRVATATATATATAGSVFAPLRAFPP